MAATSALPSITMQSHDATWDRARWEKLPEDGNRYEVIDGVLFMSTAPSFFHQWVVGQTYSALRDQIDLRGLGTTTMAPIGLFMPGCDPVQPDLLVVLAAQRSIIRDGRIDGVPALIVEVQSPSSVHYDDRTKRQAYARAGLPEYWIARPATRDVLVCTRPDAALGDYAQTQLVAPGEELVSPTLPVRFAVDSLFAGSPDTTL